MSLPILWSFAFVLLSLLSINDARADRSLRQQDPAYMYEKAGEYARAALYWHRAMRGVSEVWIPIMWGDVSNAPGKWKEYRNFVPEYRARLEKCLRLGKVSQARFAHMEYINGIWMDELVEQEDGGLSSMMHSSPSSHLWLGKPGLCRSYIAPDGKASWVESVALHTPCSLVFQMPVHATVTFYPKQMR